MSTAGRAVVALIESHKGDGPSGVYARQRETLAAIEDGLPIWRILAVRV